jgi:hypothetical protein
MEVLKKILFLFTIYINLLYSNQYECTILDITNTNTKQYTALLNNNIKIFFKIENLKITIQTLTFTSKAKYYNNFKNINNISYNEYVDNINNLHLFIYKDFKDGARLYIENEIIDAINCRKI